MTSAAGGGPPIGLVSLPTDAAAAVDLIVRAEHAGLDTVWLEMSGDEIDVPTVLAAGATATRRVRLGTAIVPAFTRHPVTLATQAVALEQLAPGRLRLGIGVGNARRLAAALDQPTDRPLARLEEYVRILRAALHHGAVVFAGRHYSADVRLPAAPRTPVLLAALGPTAFALAGALADGALAWLCPLPYLVDVARPAMASGAQREGRPIPPLVAHVAVVTTTDRAHAEAAREVARQDLARYARVPVFARMFAAAGHRVDAGVSDALLDAVAVVGDEAHVVTRLAEIAGSGIDELMVSVADGGDDQALLRVLANLTRPQPPGTTDRATATEHLATYGSLQPGHSHHHVLQDLPGVWRPGTVHGHLYDRGWAAGIGYPGIVLDPDGPAVPVMVLTSPSLPTAWPRIDAFEGPGYHRRRATVHLHEGTALEADIYVLRADPDPKTRRP